MQKFYSIDSLFKPGGANLIGKLRTNSAGTVLRAIAAQGPCWALTRIKLILLSKLGILEWRTPSVPWKDLSLDAVLNPGIPDQSEQYSEWRKENSPQFLFERIATSKAFGFIGEGSVGVADGVLHGEFPFFGYTRILGFPPDWRRCPLSHKVTPDVHWSKVDEFYSGDIKLCWETNRFGWAFALSRAYARSMDERYAESFWQLLESWIKQNPPNWGINWKCGQEASFRTMALCFSFYTFAMSATSTPQRVALFLVAIAIHAKRINAYIEYGLSQKNNHGISEGVGLWTIGLLFPELRGSADWITRGKQVIEAEVRRQIYSDGSYIQHSVNYHRVMLQDLAWALRLGERNSNLLAPEVNDAFRRATRFLHSLTDPETGWAPNYGANDGALVLPLSDCEYPDMRPVLQSCHFIAENEVLYPPGPWDEEMVWLNGEASLKAHRTEGISSSYESDAVVGGCYTIRSGDSWAMFIGTKFKDRPSHADQLHVDIWWRGENVICDAGTYSYNEVIPFEDGFASTKHHSTVTVDGTDQMTRVSRFLWADWADARVFRFENESIPLGVLEGEHDGYFKIGVVHRRAIARADHDTWIVVDDLIGSGVHNTRLHWLTPDVPFQIVATGIVDLEFVSGDFRIQLASSAESNFDLVRAGERIAGEHHLLTDPARGWSARYYGRKDPALSLVMESRSPLPVRFITVMTSGGTHRVEVPPSFNSLAIDSRPINLSNVGVSPIFMQEGK